MRKGSLRRRLLGAAALSITAALVLACLGLILLFERHVTRRLDAELDTYLRQLVAGIEVTADGVLRQKQAFAEPRFQQPYSGLYWQVIDEASGRELSSRSLWDAALALPEDELTDAVIHRHEIDGPEGSRLIAHERRVVVRSGGAPHRLRLAVAVDRSEVDAAKSAFLSDILPSLVLLASVLFGATWLQIRVGLRPLEAVRQGLHAIREGAVSRLQNDHPDEVMPLVNEVNTLLDAQDRAISKARARAADLAHGLKTPLACLAADTRQLREQGEHAIADDLDGAAETMRRHVERELARVRTRGTARGKIEVAPLVEKLAGALKRTPRGEDLSWSIEVARGVTMPIDRDDLAEVLGNLLENAMKWARSTIQVSGAVDGCGVPCLEVADDGPGIDDEHLPTVLSRGGRLNDDVPGTGPGLAIVHDVMAAYGAEITFARHPKLGGLSVTLAFAKDAQA